MTEGSTDERGAQSSGRPNGSIVGLSTNDPPTNGISRVGWLTSRCFGVILLLIAFIVGLSWLSEPRLMHPEFGEISRSSMIERPNIFEHAHYWGRRIIGLPTAERISLLRIGSAPLLWSTGGGRGKGYIYTFNPLLYKTPFWEFALTSQRRLQEVHPSDLPSIYYGMNDPRGTNTFGSDWEGHALRVPEGQIFFARVITNRSVVYVIRLAEQRAWPRGRMRVEYLTVTNQSDM